MFGDRLSCRAWPGITLKLSAALFAVPYIALLVWFHAFDVYHRDFSQTGVVVFAYNGFRLLFIFYLFWIVATPGLLLLRTFARQELDELGSLKRLACGFFAGAGIWHVVMLALGYLNLYTVAVAIALTLPVIVVSYGDARAATHEICRDLTAPGGLARETGPGWLDWLLVSLAAIAFFALLSVKGLYPGGGPDYFNHYFPYFQTVIERGGLWPNEVWYHYYYDKGVGLYFLGMLISDPLAPQLVTFCLMSAAALVIFLACCDAVPGTRWPGIAVVLFLVIYLYTPGWAHFETTHELATAFVIPSIWASAAAFARNEDSKNRLWPITAGGSITAAVICTPTIAVFFGGVFGLMFVLYVAKREYRRAGLAFLFAAISGVLLMGTVAVNYATTGAIFFSDRSALTTWPFNNLNKLYEWGALPDLVVLYWKAVYETAMHVPWSQMIKPLVQWSRLDLIFPLSVTAAVIGLVALTVRLRSGRWGGTIHAPHLIAVLLAAIPAFLAIAFLGGRYQPINFYRYASFGIPLLIVGNVAFWGLPITGTNKRFVRLAHDRRTPLGVLALCLWTIAVASHPTPFFTELLPRALRFSVGTLSIDEAYTRQREWPFRPWGAIYPGARGAYAAVGPHVPIWSFNAFTYCMLPDCRIQSMTTFILPRWDEVMFGNAEQARHALQATGHNYFLFSRDFTFDDYLASSPLFSPDSVARYFGIAWTDGVTTLLTWLGPGVQPLDDAWLVDYRRAVEESATVKVFPYDDMKRIFLSRDYAALFDPKDAATRTHLLALGASIFDGWFPPQASTGSKDTGSPPTAPSAAGHP